MAFLNDLSPEALKVAMQGGVEAWGEWGSIDKHAVYVEKVENRRFKCRCGCAGRATHRIMANGVCMSSWGCELSISRQAKMINAARN